PLSDYLARRDARWPIWMAVVIVPVTATLALCAFIAPAQWFFPLIGLQVLISGLFSSPLLSLVVSLPPVWARATTAAIKYTLIQLVGMGVGPALVGALSDYLRPEYGEESLRYAMIAALVLAFPAALLYWMAARRYLVDRAASAARLEEDSAPAAVQ
ncbi:MAG: MFS transporter, partial [Sphingobium sp.]